MDEFIPPHLCVFNDFDPSVSYVYALSILQSNKLVMWLLPSSIHRWLSYGYVRPARTHGNRELWGIMGNRAMAMGAPPEPMGIGNYGELWGIELWLWAPRPHPWESGIMGNPGVPPSTIYKNSKIIEQLSSTTSPLSPPSTIYINSINIERTLFKLSKNKTPPSLYYLQKLQKNRTNSV